MLLMSSLYNYCLVFNVGVLCILPSSYSWHKYRHTESWYALKNALYWSNVMMIATFAMTIINMYQLIHPAIFVELLKTSTAYNLHVTIGYFTFDRTYLNHHLYWQRGRMIFVHTVPLLTTYSMLTDLKENGYGQENNITTIYWSAFGVTAINLATESFHMYLANRVRYTITSNIYSWILIWMIVTPSFITYTLMHYF